MTESAQNGRGVLYGVGVGPGDPELLTLKALRCIQAAEVIAAPTARAGGASYALEVVQPLLRTEQAILKLHFPMAPDIAVRRQHRQAAAAEIGRRLDAGLSVAFLTEGDPLVHSTFGHVLAYLPSHHTVTVVPGVSSITAAAAAAGRPLVSEDQRLAVVPAVHLAGDELRRLLEAFDTVVLLKVDRALDRLIPLLGDLNLLQTSYLVERASHPEGRIIHDLGSLAGQPVHYLSLLVVQRESGL